MVAFLVCHLIIHFPFKLYCVSNSPQHCCHEKREGYVCQSFVAEFGLFLLLVISSSDEENCIKRGSKDDHGREGGLLENTYHRMTTLDDAKITLTLDFF